MALRRLAAAALVALAAVLASAPRAAPASTVVVATRDLAAGATVAPGDVVARPWPDGSLPAGTLTEPAHVQGRSLVGGVRAGEALTDVRLLGPEAVVAAAGGPDAAGVPLRLAEPGVAALLHPGVRVDVVAVTAASGAGASATGEGATGGSVPADDPGGGVVATAAVVLAVLPPPPRSTSGPVVVVALPAPDAARVAATSLSREVTVTLR